MQPETPIRGAYWVDPGRLLAGEYPGDPDATIAVDRLRRFVDAGITLFVDLTQPLELEPYAHLLRDGASHERRPIPDLGTVSTGAYRETLDLVDGALAGGHAVYLHCLGGIGRTGTVVALWLVRHGLDGGDPISRLAELRRNVPAAWMPSPQTQAQRRVVQQWTPGG